jgi:hypothetical protein
MKTLGHETCEIIEIQPARIYVIERKDERVACPYDDTIVSAKAPPQIVELCAWMEEQRKVIPPKAPLGNVINYLFRQWNRLASS